MKRYKLAGVDLRNEIHDQSGIRITWGETLDVNTDWLAASSAAYERIYRIDPEILVIVGGLCWNTDLRAMARNVGPKQAFINRKLVYTVHIYSFSFWWTFGDNMVRDVITLMALFLSLLSLMIAGCCIYSQIYTNKFIWIDHSYSLLNVAPSVCYVDLKQLAISTVPTFLAMSIVFHIGWLCLAVFYFQTANTAGCSSFANDSIPLITLASVLVFISIIAIVCFVRVSTIACLSGLVWMGLLFFSVFVVGAYLSSNAAYLDSLKS